MIVWNGFLSSSYAWRDVAPALDEAGFSVLNPDMRSYGDSNKSAGNFIIDGWLLLSGPDAPDCSNERLTMVDYRRKRSTGRGTSLPFLIAYENGGFRRKPTA
jgi:pimeloyl-ACP methyl ester carboxylesterase